MDSALTPRDIQARIRSGETLDEVAEAAGVPAESIEAFAAPVLAEREHLAGLAQDAPVRRGGEASSVGALGTVVAMSLLRAGVDADGVTWDAWREPDRNWTVEAAWKKGGQSPVALFGFDPRSRYSVARNDEARALIGEQTQHGGVRRDPDTEPTVDLNDQFNDQLAIVRALRPGERRRPAPPADEPAPLRPAPDPVIDDPSDQEDPDEVYDMVPNQSEMDVLYEMLSSFNEDSVNIYSGLDQSGFDELMASPTPPVGIRARDEDRDDDVHDESEPGEIPHERADLQGDAEAATVGSTDRENVEQDEAPQPRSTASDDPVDPEASEPTRRIRRPVPSPQPSASEPEQDALVEVDEEPKPKPRKKKGRASVPSWDEIMFGAPKK